MGQLTFWIATADIQRIKRWETLLLREGWQVSGVTSTEALLVDSAQARLGIALVDWELLRGRTAESIRRIRAQAPGVSVVMTSDPGLAPDRVIEGLEAGADDYFVNTTDDRLLIAKLKTHLRRILPSLAAALDVLKSPGGEVKLDRSRQQVWVKGTRGQWVALPGLTRTEFQFLTLFLEQPGKVLERHFILETVWKGTCGDVQSGTVDKHIESLRRKMGRYNGMIRTIYGVGYVFQDK
jgi:DNA-binding response OmpR family regulator